MHAAHPLPYPAAGVETSCQGSQGGRQVLRPLHTTLGEEDKGGTSIASVPVLHRGSAGYLLAARSGIREQSQLRG